MSLYKNFKEQLAYNVKDKLGKQNVFQVPKIEKVIVSMGIGSLVTRKQVRDFTDLMDNIKVITGQKPSLISAKRSVSSFRLREGMPVMLKTTLRKNRAYDFLARLSKLTLPMVRDFNGLPSKKFDGRGNYSIGFKDQSVFPELSPDEIKTPQGIQVNIITSTNDDEEAKTLFRELGILVSD